MKTIILDLETTGLLKPSCVPLEKQPHIIEFGAISLINGVVDKTMSELVKPPVPISEKITKITGITNKSVEDAYTFKELFTDFKNFFLGSEIVICHNAPFDIGVLEVEFARLGAKDSFELYIPECVLCTVQEYLHKYNRYVKLSELYQDVMGKKLNQTHRALDDAMALNDVLQKDNFFDNFKLSYVS